MISVRARHSEHWEEIISHYGAALSGQLEKVRLSPSHSSEILSDCGALVGRELGEELSVGGEDYHGVIGSEQLPQYL